MFVATLFATEKMETIPNKGYIMLHPCHRIPSKYQKEYGKSSCHLLCKGGRIKYTCVCTVGGGQDLGMKQEQDSHTIFFMLLSHLKQLSILKTKEQMFQVTKNPFTVLFFRNVLTRLPSAHSSHVCINHYPWQSHSRADAHTEGLQQNFKGCLNQT